MLCEEFFFLDRPGAKRPFIGGISESRICEGFPKTRGTFLKLETATYLSIYIKGISVSCRYSFRGSITIDG